MVEKKRVNSKKIPSVLGNKLSMPFSQMTLALSLENIGIGYEKANKITGEIFDEMIDDDIREITRKNLRLKVFEKLKKEEGKSAAVKYMKLRRILDNKEPLIVLVGGSTGSGKHTVSMELARRLDIMTVISTDIIREIMRSLFSNEILPMIHTSSYNAYKKLWMPLAEGKNQETIAFREQALRVNAGIRGLIKRSVQEKTSLIINGVHILPDILDSSDVQKARIIKVFLYVSKKDEHKKRFYIRGAHSEERTARKYLQNFSTIRRIQNYINKRAKARGFLRVNNKDSKEAALTIIDHIIRRLER